MPSLSQCIPPHATAYPSGWSVQFRHPLAPGTLLFHGLRQHQTLVGGLLDMQLGIRVIASTHIDLDAAVEVGDSARRRMTA